MTTAVIRRAPPTTRLDLDFIDRIFSGEDAGDSWSWQLACIEYPRGLSSAQQEIDAQTLGTKLNTLEIVLDDTIVFHENLAMTAVGIVWMTKPRNSPTGDVWTEGYLDPAEAATCVRSYLTKRGLHRNITALVLADNVTLQFLDVLLGRKPGGLTPTLMRGHPYPSCMVTLQNDQLGIPQVKWVQPDIIAYGQPISREDINSLEDVGGLPEY